MELRVVCTLLLCVSTFTVASRAAAVPVLIDFTDARWSGAAGQTAYSQTYGSLGVTLSSASGPLTFNADEAPLGGPDALALDGDGIGIGDDEIGWLGGESLDVLFSSEVTLLGYYLLDFFAGEGPGGVGELALATLHAGGTDQMLLDIGTATDDTGFYLRTGVWAGTTSLSFSAAALQGFSGDYADFALGGLLVDVVPVPEPAALGLLGFGLAGLVVARRRRRVSVCAG